MSTINEALKKAQEQKQQKQEELLLPPPAQKEQFQPPSGEMPTAVKKTPRKFPVNIFLLTIAFIIIASAFFVLNSMYTNKPGLKKTLSITGKDNLPPKQQIESQPPHEVATQPPSTFKEFADIVSPADKTPHLALNGIMYDQKSPMAIINNKIVIEGQTIENATVVKILKDKVILSCEGKEIKLEVK